MKTVIVYDSVFGNTEKIALAIREALTADSVVTVKPEEVRPAHLAGVKMLIVGSPTRAFQPTKAVAAFIKNLPPDSLTGVGFLAFDTRMSKDDVDSRMLRAGIRLFGYAAATIAKKLQKKKGALLAAPEGFYVDGYEGPLKPGELTRAKAWARSASRAAEENEAGREM